MGSFKVFSWFLWVFLGSIIWLLFLEAGIHPTIAGVLVAFTVPLKRRVMLKDYTNRLENIVSDLKNCESENKLILSTKQIGYIDDLEDWTSRVQSPLQHLEHKLHSWVAFMIMPLFALANAGIIFNFKTGVDINIILTIASSLLVGNAIGVPLLTMIGVKLGLTELPNGMKSGHLFGIGLLAGIGFTMSIFISGIAFADNPILINSAKIGILAGSFLSGISGYLLLRFTAGNKDPIKIQNPGETVHNGD